MTRIGKYLQVFKHPRPSDRKTDIWLVLGNRENRIGQIGWYGPWRQYAFDPYPNCTFNSACLADLARFLDRINTERRHGTKEDTDR